MLSYTTEKASLGIALEKQKRYYALIKFRKLEQLKSTEQQELIAISNEIEERNAARMPFVFQLAAYKQVQAKLLIKQLGIL